MYVCKCTYIYLYMYVLPCRYIYTQNYTYMCILALSYCDMELVHRTHAFMYIYINSQKRIHVNYEAYYIKTPKSWGVCARHHSASIMRFDWSMSVCVWLCVCVCVCARARACFLCMHACMCVYIHTQSHVCTHTYVTL